MAHPLRWSASSLAAAYLQYASLGLRRTALHLGHFERPARNGVSVSSQEVKRSAVSDQSSAAVRG